VAAGGALAISSLQIPSDAVSTEGVPALCDDRVLGAYLQGHLRYMTGFKTEFQTLCVPRTECSRLILKFVKLNWITKGKIKLHGKCIFRYTNYMHVSVCLYLFIHLLTHSIILLFSLNLFIYPVFDLAYLLVIYSSEMENSTNSGLVLATSPLALQGRGFEIQLTWQTWQAGILVANDRVEQNIKSLS